MSASQTQQHMNNDESIKHQLATIVAQSLASGESFAQMSAKIADCFNLLTEERKSSPAPQERMVALNGRKVSSEWLKNQLLELGEILIKDDYVWKQCQLIFESMARIFFAEHAILYILDNGGLRCFAQSSPGFNAHHFPRTLKLGEGRAGRCLVEKKRLNFSETWSGTTVSIMALPILIEGEAKAVVELVFPKEYDGTHSVYLTH